MSETLYLLDGSALAYRAHFALMRTGLTNRKGEPTGALLGFANTLHMLVKQEKPDYLAVVFDAPGPTFRHEAYGEYKANRAATPDDLRFQLPIIREMVRVWPCVAIEVRGVEADDVIGSYAVQLSGPDLDVVVVTGDKDFYQILSEHVRILNPGRGGTAAVEARVVGPDDVPAKFGVPEPRQVVDVLSLMGDASDNVPGIPGIGPKTAGALIAEHGSLDGLFERLDRVKAGLREKLLENRDSVLQARSLVTIRTDLDLPVSLESLRARPTGTEELWRFLEEQDFTKLLQDLRPARATRQEPLFLLSRQSMYRLVSGPQELSHLAERLLRASHGFAVSVLASDSDPMLAEVLGLGLAVGPEEAYYVDARSSELPMDSVRRVLGPLLADPSIPKVLLHGKRDLRLLERAGLPLEGLAFDVSLAAYLLDPEGTRTLPELVKRELGEATVSLEDLLGKGASKRSIAELSPQEALGVGAEEADFVLRLRGILEPRLAEHDLAPLYRDVEMPLLFVLKEMEDLGVRVDVSFLRAMRTDLCEELERLAARAVALAETPFNLNSPTQLGEVLFERLALPRGKKTKTGYSTDVEVLEALAVHHDLPRVVLEYRQLAKLLSTYVEALPALVREETGRIHGTFHQVVAATGRLSSSDPNLQNIPTRTEVGKRIRRAFVPGEPGWVLLSADYSQIELRIMAHMSGDPALTQAFREGVDVHRDTAARLFGESPDRVSELQRAQAKTVNFGVLYGQGPYGLARVLGISVGDASEFIRAYKSQYAGVIRYQEDLVRQAAERGYVTTLLGRRRYLPALRSRGYAARAASERLAVNTPIQGSAADLIKVAMVRLDRALERQGLEARLLLQVHDELVLECPEREAGPLGDLVRDIMAGAVPLTVPVVVNLAHGLNWAEIH